MIKTFLQWAEANKLDVTITDAEPSKKTTDESAKRTGQTANYPDVYYRGQYPALSLTPHKATSVLDQQQKPNSKYGGQRAAN